MFNVECLKPGEKVQGVRFRCKNLVVQKFSILISNPYTLNFKPSNLNSLPFCEKI